MSRVRVSLPTLCLVSCLAQRLENRGEKRAGSGARLPAFEWPLSVSWLCTLALLVICKMGGLWDSVNHRTWHCVPLEKSQELFIMAAKIWFSGRTCWVSCFV